MIEWKVQRKSSRSNKRNESLNLIGLFFLSVCVIWNFGIYSHLDLIIGFFLEFDLFLCFFFLSAGWLFTLLWKVGVSQVWWDAFLQWNPTYMYHLAGTAVDHATVLKVYEMLKERKIRCSIGSINYIMGKRVNINFSQFCRKELSHHSINLRKM